jgi:hypothetical protein
MIDNIIVKTKKVFGTRELAILHSDLIKSTQTPLNIKICEIDTKNWTGSYIVFEGDL